MLVLIADFFSSPASEAFCERIVSICRDLCTKETKQTRRWNS